VERRQESGRKSPLPRSLCVYALALLGACGQRLEYSGDVNPTDLSHARTQALMWLQEVTDANHDVLAPKALQVTEFLKNRQIVALPSEGESSPCESPTGSAVTLAFVVQPVDFSKIYFCPAGRDTHSAEASQILIHEAIHLSGLTDECSVTLLENLMVHSAGRTPYRNAYVSSCGLKLITSSDYDDALSSLTPQ